ncbi:sce7726 family protein [Vibrio sp. VPAP30]|uniref:sce7726 family protein n=1 Tax=Vibrio sp. VPAP30 TaxID=1647102 RepID=UPI00065A7EB2|nr:sce7726 family protein [Vibrio sp. VPAP30]KLN65719.1 hypothetical protein ZX61_08960 [Vibrio sp. VPAP30]
MEYRLLAKLFSSSELKKIAAGDLKIFNRVGEVFSEFDSASSIPEFYDTAYRLLLKHYRNEYVVKNEIANKILLGRHSMKTTAMMSELRTGKNIADCVILNGHSTCYEIKTEFDSLVRFHDQLSSYLKAYDKTYIVTHANHLEEVLALHAQIPRFGVIELTKRNSLKPIITAPISGDFDQEITFDTLRKPEYVHIAEKIAGKLPEMPNSQVYEHCKEVYQSLSPETANDLFKESLKLFRANDHKFINSLPKSLKNIGISYQFSRQEKNNLLCSLMNNTSIC